MIKTLKLGMEITYLTIMKVIYDKLTANNLFNGERLKVDPLRSGREQGCPLLLNTALEVPARGLTWLWYQGNVGAIRQEKEIKSIQQKGRSKIVSL